MKPEQKALRIVDAAATLLLRQGVRKTGMEDMATAAGVSKVTVYKYFGDRDGVLNAVCARLTDRCLKALADEAEGKTDTVARMMGFTRVLSDFIRSGEHTLCGELEAAAGSSAVHFAAFESKVREMIFSLIREGKTARMIEETLSDEVVYHYIEMGLCYFKYDTLYRERMWVDEAFRKAFLHLIWRNIFTAEALQDIETG